MSLTGSALGRSCLTPGIAATAARMAMMTGGQPRWPCLAGGTRDPRTAAPCSQKRDAAPPGPWLCAGCCGLSEEGLCLLRFLNRSRYPGCSTARSEVTFVFPRAELRVLSREELRLEGAGTSSNRQAVAYQALHQRDADSSKGCGLLEGGVAGCGLPAASLPSYAAGGAAVANSLLRTGLACARHQVSKWI